MAIEFRTRTKSKQPNPTDIGACCDYDGETNTYSCEGNVSYIDCKRRLGVFRGAGSECGGANECPTTGSSGLGLNNLNSDQHGACVTCSTCTDNVTEDQCITQDNFDAEFFGGKVCQQVTSGNLSSLLSSAYACCIDDGCFDTCNPTYCAELGGILHDGTNTASALTCASNPCNPLDNSDQSNAGTCCRNGSCIGVWTRYDCERNGGTWKGEGTNCENYNCATDQMVGPVNNAGQEFPVSGLNGAQVVCSKPTPRKYYNTNGDWNGTFGPTFGNETTIVSLEISASDCTNGGGVVCSTDGNINKAIMWGGCQFYDTDTELWKCESKTYQQCLNLSGRWYEGIFCDSIRDYPASGLYFGDSIPSGINTSEKYLAGRCVVVDRVGAAGDSDYSYNCGDMQTEYQCVNAVRRLYEKYTQLGYTETDIVGNIESHWTAGKRCSDCTSETEIETNKVLGLCILNQTNTGSIPTDYTYTTGNPPVCLDQYSRSDCEMMHGQWLNTCDTCTDWTARNTSHVAATHLGSCCYDDDTNGLTCLDSKTYGECLALDGFFHGPGTRCSGRDCSYVAYLTTDNGVNAECECQVSDDPDEADAEIVRIFASRNLQGNLWAGSTCGDPTVDAVPYWENGLNFSSNKMVLYNLPTIEQEGIPEQLKFSDNREIGTDRYNLYNEGFRTFMTSDGGSFIDDLVIQNAATCYFRVDKQTPIRIPYSKGTLKGLTGSLIETNQPADSFFRIVTNEPSFFWNHGPIPPHRKVKYINLDGMVNLRELSVNAKYWSSFQTDFANQTFNYMTILDVSDSGLTGIDISNAPALEKINLRRNSIETLDLSANTYCTDVDLSYNDLESVTFGNDKIYLSSLNLSYNNILSTINYTGQHPYPQLRDFTTIKCSLSDLSHLTDMPYLRNVIVIDNPITSLDLSGNPSLQSIVLDGSVDASTTLENISLPNSSNRFPSSVPTSITEAVIPTNASILRAFSFRMNRVKTDGYDAFVNKLVNLAAITRNVNFGGTIFNSAGTLTANPTSVSCKVLDFNNVTDTENGDQSSVLNFLIALFKDATITHNKNITIDLTGINTSVNWGVDGTYRTALSAAIGSLFNRLTFIV